MISVLYVDDEPALLEIAKIFLEEAGGINVRTSISATDALALPELLSYDAIISDFQMPNMDGIAFLKAVRQRSTDIPFILFTGRGREEIVIEAINNGADFYLQKGGAPEAQFAELVHKIRQAVRRKQAERSFHDSERRFSDIINFLPDATFAIDRSGQVIAWNRATEDMTGVPAGEMLGKGDYAYAVPFYGEQRPMLIDLIDKTDEKISEYYTNVYRSGTSLTAETDHTHPKGHQILVLAKACHLYNQDGEITGAIESIRDVTEQKRLEADLERKHGELQASYEQLTAAEEELREQYDELAGSEQQIRVNEERLVMAQELGHTGSWDYNPATNEIWASSEGLRIFGFHRDAGYFPLADIEACIPDRDRVNRALVDLLEHGLEYNIEYAITPADGSAPRIIHSFARLEKDSRGKPTRVIGVIHDITERKQQEEELAFHNAILATQQETSLDAILIVDENGKIINYNRQFTTLWRVPEDLVARGVDGPVLQFVTGQLADPASFLSRVKYLYGNKHEKSFEELLLKDGRVLERFSAPMLGKSGKCYGRVWYFRDITGRKRTEGALRESEERLRLLIRHAPAALAMFDRDMRYLVASQRWIADYHLGDREIIGHSHYEIFPEISEDLKAVHRRSLAGEVLSANEDKFEREDGSVQWLSWEVRPWYTAGGAIGGIIIFSEDITERRKAEEDLRESEARLRRLADSAPDMIYRMSLPDGRYEYVSPASLAMTGYTPEEFYANPGLVRHLLHPDWHEYFRKQWEALLENKAPSFYEFQIIDRAGNTRWLNQRNMLVTDERGKPVAIEGIVTDITQQKTTERELRRSELRSLAVSENAGEWIWEVDAGGIYRYSSPAVSKILGYRPDELVGKMHYYDLFDPSVREELKALTLAGFGSREPFRDFVNLNRHKNGKPVILSTSATPVFDDTGAFTGYCGVDEDITENQRAQEELRESRRMLADAMDLAYLVNWEYDVDTDMFTFDDRFYALYGTSAEREGGTRMSSGTYASEFVHPDDRWMVAEEVRKARDTAADAGPVSYVEHRIVRRDGGIRTIAVRIAFTKDEKGRIVRTHGASQDITERKRAEEILRENEEKYRSLVETSPDIIWEIDPRGIFRYVSPMIRPIMGYDPEEMIGKPITDLMPEQDRPAGQEYLSRMITTDGPIQPFEVPGRHRDGREMVIEIRPARVVDPAGRVTGFRGVARDVTESKRAGDAIRMANRKLHLLSGITRHDISNQLMSLNGFIALVRKKTTDPSLENHFSRIREASDQIMSMIAFTREYEKIGVHAPVWKELREVVEEAVKGILPAQIALKNDIPAGTMVFADPLMVKVFFNLIDNSVRHGERVTEIRASCHRSGNDLVVVWEDNGVGIPGKEKDRIFEKGFGKHTGLGMFLGREILSLTGITITETGAPGTGARFEMVVPKGAFRTVPE
jgi:PAS domain S-box-containing protein